MKKIVILLVLWMPVYLSAQIDYDKFPKASTTYYIQNVFVWNGQMSDRLTNIVIKDGKISDVGPSARKPKGAILVKADSMYVYPGFIDVLNTSTIKSDENKERPDVKFPGLPPDEVAGITPYISAEESIRDNKTDVTKMRADGFTISQLAHGSGMLPGGTYIAALHDDTDQTIITDQHHQVAQFKGAGGVYPSTLIAVMAKFRDLYKNAEIYSGNLNAHKSRKDVGVIPSSSKSIAALVPLTKKQEALFFIAPKKLDAMKVINLQQELGFKGVITGIGDLSGLEKEILDSKLPIALSTKLPKEKKEEKKDSTDTEEVSKEVMMLKKRAMKAYTDHLGQAARLDSLNVPFAFASLGEGTSGVKESVSRMVEAGLDEDTAIKALTSHAAQILGISKLVGSVDRGKLAHLTITDKPYLDEKSAIRYVVVGDEVYPYEKKKKDAKAAIGDIDIAGDWTYSVETPDGSIGGKMIMTKSGDAYDIEISNEMDPNDSETISGVALDSGEMEFSFTSGEGITVDLSITFTDSDNFSGTLTYGPMGSFPISGSKAPN